MNTDGKHLIIEPKGKIDADLRARLFESKPALINWLQTPPCPGWQAVPPQGLPLNSQSGLEGEDLDTLVSYLVRQARQPGPLAAWILEREGAYFDAGVRDWRQQARLACRDAATWQLNRKERGALELVTRLSAAPPPPR